MAGLYLHFPFCAQACSYCNFHFSTSLRHRQPMANALLAELHRNVPQWKTHRFASVYFGGGTPSLLTDEEAEALVSAVDTLYNVDEAAERTLEANPDDVSPHSIALWRRLGFNRLSIGIQTLEAPLLQMLNRRHSPAQALDALHLLHRAGFDSLTADLIFGIPGQSLQSITQQIDLYAQLGIQHFSAYALTVEPRTLLHRQIEKGEVPPPDEDFTAECFLAIHRHAEALGYEHYEVSNYARPGHRAVHNSAYWHGEPYLGIGPSAHSFLADTRWWNVASNTAYIQALEEGAPFSESETLDATALANEAIMLGLRTVEGIGLEGFARRFGETALQNVLQNATRWLQGGHLRRQGGRISLSPPGMLLYDRICGDLFLEDHATDSRNRTLGQEVED